MLNCSRRWVNTDDRSQASGQAAGDQWGLHLHLPVGMSARKTPRLALPTMSDRSHRHLDHPSCPRRPPPSDWRPPRKSTSAANHSPSDCLGWPIGPRSQGVSGKVAALVAAVRLTQRWVVRSMRCPADRTPQSSQPEDSIPNVWLHGLSTRPDVPQGGTQSRGFGTGQGVGNQMSLMSPRSAGYPPKWPPLQDHLHQLSGGKLIVLPLTVVHQCHRTFGPHFASDMHHPVPAICGTSASERC